MKFVSRVLPLAAVALVLCGCHKQAKDMNGKVVHFPGSYAQTCRNVSAGTDDVITAECMDAKSQFHTSSIKATACPADIANMNGVLACAR
jgi:hypothetical protein